MFVVFLVVGWTACIFYWKLLVTSIIVIFHFINDNSMFPSQKNIYIIDDRGIGWCGDKTKNIFCNYLIVLRRAKIEKGNFLLKLLKNERKT